MPNYVIQVEKYITGVIIMEADSKEEVKKYIEDRNPETELEVNWLTSRIQIHKGLDSIKEVIDDLEREESS